MGQGNTILKVDDPVILVYQTHDGDETKFIRAHVTSHDDTALPGSPFTLVHASNGKYIYFDFANLKYPTGAEQVQATYIPYDDAGFTQESKKHSRGLDIFQIDPSESSTVNIEDLLEKIDQIINILSSTFPGAEIVGIIDRNEELVGRVTEEEVVGLIHSDEIDGVVIEEEIIGFVSANEVTGLIEEP